MTHVARITVYPFKSLDGVDLQSAQVLPAGGLKHDRRWKLVDAEGKTVGVRNERRLVQIRALFTTEFDSITVASPDRPAQQFSLVGDLAPLAAWFSEYLSKPVTLVENTEQGFPDDLDSPGPTIISQGSLAAMHGWWPELSADELFRRMRANVLLAATEPFWEDRLVPAEGSQPFTIGNIHWLGDNVCQRCVVPTLNSQTGEPTRGFAKQSAAQRQASLPAWASPNRFDHYYRISINTRLAPGAQADLSMRVGDAVTLET